VIIKPNLVRILFFLIALASCWSLAEADSPAPRKPYKLNVGDDRYVFVMLPIDSIKKDQQRKQI